MRKATMIAAAVAAGVLGTGAVVTPVVLAANDDQTAQRPGPRWDGGAPGGGMGPGAGHRMRDHRMRDGMRGDARYGMHHGMGPGRGTGDCPGYAESGTLTREQKQRLAEQAVLEKISHDVYVAFGKDTGDRWFEHVAWSETRHLEAVRTLMSRYGVADPTRGLDAGEFSGKAQDAYRAYVKDGASSLQASLDTAQEIEQKDIAGLENAADGVDAPDVEQVYEHLARASEMHLAAFSR